MIEKSQQNRVSDKTCEETEAIKESEKAAATTFGSIFGPKKGEGGMTAKFGLKKKSAVGALIAFQKGSSGDS